MKPGQIFGKNIDDLAPGIIHTALLQQLPVLLDLATSIDRHQLQRPHQNLAEMACAFFGGELGF